MLINWPTKFLLTRQEQSCFQSPGPSLVHWRVWSLYLKKNIESNFWKNNSKAYLSLFFGLQWSFQERIMIQSASCDTIRLHFTRIHISVNIIISNMATFTGCAFLKHYTELLHGTNMIAKLGVWRVKMKRKHLAKCTATISVPEPDISHNLGMEEPSCRYSLQGFIHLENKKIRQVMVDE